MSEIVGYHEAEGVSLYNHHLMACPEHVTPDAKAYAPNAVTLEDAQREADAGFPFVCDECDEPFLNSKGEPRVKAE